MARLKITIWISTSFENFILATFFFAIGDILPVAYHVTRNVVTNEMLTTFGDVRFYDLTSRKFIFNETVIN